MDLELRKVLLYAIVPALIAGAFSFAPKLYDILTEPRAEITYETIVGPSLADSTGHKQIGTVVVRNSGKKPLSSITVSIAPKKGTIQAFQAQMLPTLRGTTSRTDQGLLSTVPALLPSEDFVLTFMMATPDGDAELVVAARSNEVKGEPASRDPAKKSAVSELIGAGSSALSVFVMVLLAIRMKGPLGALAGLGGKQDILYYIAARTRIPELRVLNTSLTYLRMADILLAHGLQGAAAEQAKAISALKCLLLIKDMADTSRSIIVRNIALLEGENFSQNEIDMLCAKGVEVTRALQLRALIDAFIQSPAAFLPRGP